MKSIFKTTVFLLSILAGITVSSQLGLQSPGFVGQLSKKASSTASPSDISGLVLWLKPESLSGADGTAISQWDDSSANAWHATNSVSGGQPYITNAVINGYNAAYFDGGDSLRLSGASVSILRNKPGCSVLAVVNRNTTAAGDKYILHIQRNAAVYARFLVGLTGNTNVTAGGRRLDTDSFAYFGSAHPSPLATWYVHEAIGNYSDSHALTLVNATPVHTNTAWLTDGNTQDTDSANMNTVGGASSALNLWIGWIAELVVYDAALSESDRQTVEGYLRNKYAIW